MRCKTLLSLSIPLLLLLSIAGSLSFAGCGGVTSRSRPPSSTPFHHFSHRHLRRSHPPDRANQPVLGHRCGNRQLQFQRHLVRNLRNSLKLRPLHRLIDGSRVRFRYRQSNLNPGHHKTGNRKDCHHRARTADHHSSHRLLRCNQPSTRTDQPVFGDCLGDR